MNNRFDTAATPPIEVVPSADAATSHYPPAPALDAADIAAISAVCATDTGAGTRAEHGRDWWPLAMRWSLEGRVPQIPSVVCRPSTTEEVSRLLALCNGRGIAVTPSGGRSGVCGAAIPLHGGVALDMGAMQGIESIDTVSGIVCALAGTFGPDLENAVRAEGLTVGHFPQSFDISTVGGWVACRGAGQYSTRYGKIEDMVHGLEVVMADGTVVRTGGAPAAAVGPDLNQLFLGSEGTLGVITRVWLRAHPVAEVERRAAYSFANLSDGFEACRRAVRAGATPAVLRLYDGAESKRSHGGDGTEAVLLVLDEGSEAVVDSAMTTVHDAALALGARVLDDGLVEKWMHHRNDTSGLQALTRKGYVVDTMEVAANWAALDAVVEQVESAMLSVPHARTATCHLSHSYIEGACVYFTFAANPPAEEFEATYLAMWERGQNAAIAAGASLSHHHGVGLSRAGFVRAALGNGLDVLRAVKHALDPAAILNPGKLGL
ncbi:MAG: FAD-binding oxidoreductase [Ilumatobacteraceae bacterium]